MGECDMGKPILALTMGDPAGVGPEIAIKALANAELRARFVPVVIGVAEVLREAAALLGDPVEVCRVEGVEDAGGAGVAVLEPAGIGQREFPKGSVDAACGEAAFRCIEMGIALALEKRVAGLVTNPIHKKALRLAGHDYAGHTEILRDLTGAENCAMMLVGEGLRVVHVTTHCALRDVASQCRRERILQVTRLTRDALVAMGIAEPRLGMAALNPHAGDEGLFGDEEEREILPAVLAAREEGIDVSDPLPADTIFSLARGGRFDAVVVQYHDQGHIPVKLLGFEYDDASGQWTSVSGINVTLGLPIVRTSVDHGTAFDQAWQGTASAESLENAIELAIQMAAGGGLTPARCRT